MAFADILGFVDPAVLSQIAVAGTEGVSFGHAGEVVITPMLLLVAAVFIQVAIAMIYLSKTLERRANRVANMAAAAITTVFIIGGGSLTPYYIFFAGVELLCLATIALRAWRWRAA